MLFVLLISLHFLTPKSTTDHAVYLSVLEIDGKQMRAKVFTDNIQDAIRNDSEEFVPTAEEEFPNRNRSAIEKYFQKKIELEINNRGVSISLQEASLEGDSYWITFHLETAEKWETFYLKADYLMELFPDQTNVVKIINEKPRFFRLTKSNASCSFSL